MTGERKAMTDLRSFEAQVLARFDRFHGRFDRIEARLGNVEAKIGNLEGLQDEERAAWERLLAAVHEITAKST